MSRKERGVSMIELAICIPLLLFLVICLIDVAIYYTAKGVAVTAASKGATLATVIPELDDVDEAKREAAIAEVINTATSHAYQSFFGPDTGDDAYKLFRPSGAEVVNSPVSPYGHKDNPNRPIHINFPIDIHSAETADELALDNAYIHEQLLAQPMEVKVYAEVDLLFLDYFFGDGGKIKIEESVFAYRQPTNELSNPKPIECGGDVDLVTEDGCLCDEDDPTRVINEISSLCSCRGDLVEVDGRCVCPGNLTDRDEDFVCSCEVRPLCMAGERVNMDNCSCERMSCENELFVYNPDTDDCDICNPDICSDREIYPFGAYGTGSTCSSCTACGEGTILKPDTQNTCVCDNFVLGECDPYEREYFSNTSCQCETCPEFQRPRNDGLGCYCDVFEGKAACAVNGQDFDAQSCRCTDCTNLRELTVASTGEFACSCPTDPEKTLNFCHDQELYFDSRRCECRACPGGRELDKERNICVECPPAPPECDEPSDVLYYDRYNCRCQRCPDATELIDGRCLCPGSNPALGFNQGCPDQTFRNRITCECETCREEKFLERLGSIWQWCRDCPDGKVQDPDDFTKCICENSPTELETQDPDTCEITSCTGGKVPNEAGDDCICRPEFKLACEGSGGLFNDDTCTCNPCREGEFAQTAECCESLGLARIYYGGEYTCGPESCTQGLTVNNQGFCKFVETGDIYWVTTCGEWTPPTLNKFAATCSGRCPGEFCIFERFTAAARDYVCDQPRFSVSRESCRLSGDGDRCGGAAICTVVIQGAGS